MMRGGWRGVLGAAVLLAVSLALAGSAVAAGGAAKPSISSFTPTGATATKVRGGAEWVTITGRNFTGVTAVKIGALKAPVFSVIGKSILARMPSNAKTGKISVTTKAGTGTSASSFTVA
jgi:hypothetical protein